MGIGSAIGGIASLGGALIGSSASSSAASQQQAASLNAQKNAVATQNYLNAAEQPYVQAGGTALENLQASLGEGGPGTNLLAANGINGLTFQPTQAQLEATPGYQFAMNQGQQGVANSNAAQGRGVSGAALKGAANYAQGLAEQTYMNQDQIFQNNLGNVLNPLQAMTGVGQQALGVESGNNTNLTGQTNQLIQSAGAQGAAGTIGSANALAGGLNGIGNSALNYGLYNQILGGNGAGGGQGLGGALSTAGGNDGFGWG